MLKQSVNSQTLSRIIIGCVGLFAYVLLMIPLFVLMMRALASGGWQSLPDSSIVLDAIGLSLRTTSISIIFIVLLGLPLAYIFARWDFRGKTIATVLIELPIVMPPAVAGLALLLTFGRRGAVGMSLSMFGINIAFTMWAVIIAQVFVAAPFFIRATQIGFANIPDELEDAARVDGATEWEVWRWVTFPLALRAIIAGLILSWARAIGEFGATILFAGSLQGRTQTMPLLVYAVFERDIDAAIWTGVLLIIVAFVALLMSQLLTASDDT
ncbi:MAG: ABC transporter permease [Chloroflexota bacterium]